MKYLKTYENKTYTLKKYIVWRIDERLRKFTILKVIGDNSGDEYKRINLERIYMYDLEIDKEYDISEEDENTYNISIGHIIFNMDFEADTYEKCFEYLELKLASNKYNI